MILKEWKPKMKMIYHFEKQVISILPENKHIEYKQQSTPELESEMVAFPNSNEGGIIYFGVDKAGRTKNLR